MVYIRDPKYFETLTNVGEVIEFVAERVGFDSRFMARVSEWEVASIRPDFNKTPAFGTLFPYREVLESCRNVFHFEWPFLDLVAPGLAEDVVLTVIVFDGTELTVGCWNSDLLDEVRNRYPTLSERVTEFEALS